MATADHRRRRPRLDLRPDRRRHDPRQRRRRLRRGQQRRRHHHRRRRRRRSRRRRLRQRRRDRRRPRRQRPARRGRDADLRRHRRSTGSPATTRWSTATGPQPAGRRSSCSTSARRRNGHRSVRLSGGDVLQGDNGTDLIFGQGNGAQPVTADRSRRRTQQRLRRHRVRCRRLRPHHRNRRRGTSAPGSATRSTAAIGDDYIEGNHGNDLIFGNGTAGTGQDEDDIAGGGSANDGASSTTPGSGSAPALLDGFDTIHGDSGDDNRRRRRRGHRRQRLGQAAGHQAARHRDLTGRRSTSSTATPR